MLQHRLLKPLVLTGMSRYALWSKNRFLQKVEDPVGVQTRYLMQLLRHHQQTERGRQHDLASIDSIEAFCDRLPVTHYADYDAAVQRIAAGETNILTPDPVTFITITSGTTGKRKLIPVTQRFQQSLQRANIVSFGFGISELQQRGDRLRPMLVTNSVQPNGITEGGIEYGLASTGSLRAHRGITAPLFSFPYEVLQISDSRTRHYIVLLFSLQCRNLGIMIANFPMLMLRTCQYLETEAPALIRDLRDGTLTNDLDLTPACRDYLSSIWHADPQRATELETVLEQQGRLTPQHAWPHLAALITARGGTSDFYFERFQDYFGDLPIFGGVYGCSEATYAISTAFNQDGNVLAIESGFFEFVPAAEWDKSHPKTLLPHQVTVGDYYRILVTNDAGLYRYDIGDVVEVVGFLGQTPLIVFRYRLGGQINSTSEKTTEFHVIQVINRLQQEFDVAFDDFCVTLSEQPIPAHYWVNIELAGQQTLEQPSQFLQRFDALLQEENHHYKVMRRDQVPPPQLRLLKAGSFDQLRAALMKRQNTPEHQLKIPHVSENRTLLADLPIETEVPWPNA